MQKNRFILTLLFFIHAFVLQAQVTIGSGKEPEEYCTLEIDGRKQGLRLSKLTTEGRKGLIKDTDSQSLKDAARGLLVFNTDSLFLEFYDGSQWRPLRGFNGVTNGLTKDNATGKVRLGGQLSENTEIDQEGQSLSFTAAAGSTGSFHVKPEADDVESSLKVDASSVTFEGLDSFSIMSGANKVVDIVRSGADNTVNLNVGSLDTEGLNVNNGALKIVGNTTTFDKKLAYKDGTQGKDKILYYTAKGNKAVWKELKSETEKKVFKLHPNRRETVNYGENPLSKSKIPLTSGYLPLTETMTLSAGKWLISGTLFTCSTSTIGQNSLGASMVQIIKDEGKATQKLVYSNGAIPEAKPWPFTSTSVACYLELDQAATIVVKVRGHDANTYLVKGGGNASWIDPKGRGSQFYALKIPQ